MDFLPSPTQKISVKILFGPHSGSYSSYVDEVDARGITVAQPTIGGIPIPLGVGHAVRLEYTQTGARVSYNTRVLGSINRGVPLIKIAIPDRSEVQRVQLRDFVRQEASLNLTLKVISAPDSAENPRPDISYPSRTKDISGGGSQIVCPEPYPPATQLDIHLEIDGTVLHLVTEVIRAISQINDREWWVATKFVGMNEKDRDVIIRYIFNLQRDLRRKGLY